MLNKSGKFILSALVVLHFIGWGLSSIFYEWEYKNNNNVVSSYFFSNLAGNFKGFFWEYDLYKRMTTPKQKMSNAEAADNIIYIVAKIAEDPQIDIESAKSQIKSLLENIDPEYRQAILNKAKVSTLLTQNYNIQLIKDVVRSYKTKVYYKSDRLKNIENKIVTLVPSYADVAKQNDQVLKNAANNKLIDASSGKEVPFDEKQMQEAIKYLEESIDRVEALYDFQQ